MRSLPPSTPLSSSSASSSTLFIGSSAAKQSSSSSTSSQVAASEGEVDCAYLGTYLFLVGCIVFSFHSVLLLHAEPSLLNLVYFAGAQLFTCGSVCHAVDAERGRRKRRATQPLTVRKAE